MLMIRDFSTMFQQMSGMPIGSRSGKNMLKNAGIDTNSVQYKAVPKEMLQGRGDEMVSPLSFMCVKNILTR